MSWRNSQVTSEPLLVTNKHVETNVLVVQVHSRSPNSTPLSLVSLSPPTSLTRPPLQPFNVPLLDQIITHAYSPSSPSRAAANTVLMTLQECPDLWTRADTILEGTDNPTTKFFGLQILDATIR